MHRAGLPWQTGPFPVRASGNLPADAALRMHQKARTAAAQSHSRPRDANNPQAMR